MGNDHQHDGGLTADLPRLIGRRNLLALIGGIGLAGLATRPAMALECIALPWETAGPYPADGTNSREGQVINVLTQKGVIREDLRSSFAGLSGTAEGVPLTLDITLLDAAGCTPLASHAIYLWHCNSEGRYSLYDLPDQNYLRGVAVSDENGKLRFQTIIPGCYDGRWPHIHFEIFESAGSAVSGDAALLTAQIAMSEADMKTVYESDEGYAASAENLAHVSIASDNVFSDNTKAQIAQQTPTMTGDPAHGYRATISIPVDFTTERSAGMAPPPPMGGPGGNPPPPPPGN
ncbi:MAG: hypothetical protein ACK5LJ_03970 [Paracoccus sp. (in: a-proteobacteria)]